MSSELKKITKTISLEEQDTYKLLHGVSLLGLKNFVQDLIDKHGENAVFRTYVCASEYYQYWELDVEVMETEQERDARVAKETQRLENERKRQEIWDKLTPEERNFLNLRDPSNIPF